MHLFLFSTLLSGCKLLSIIIAHQHPGCYNIPFLLLKSPGSYLIVFFYFIIVWSCSMKSHGSYIREKWMGICRGGVKKIERLMVRLSEEVSSSSGKGFFRFYFIFNLARSSSPSLATFHLHFLLLYCNRWFSFEWTKFSINIK